MGLRVVLFETGVRYRRPERASRKLPHPGNEETRKSRWYLHTRHFARTTPSSPLLENRVYDHATRTARS